MTQTDSEIKTKLEKKTLIYPIEEIEKGINVVAKRRFGKEIDVLKRENAEKLDIRRRKYRAKYYAQQDSIKLNEEAENILETHTLYEDDYGIITYLLTYFWRNYPMLKFILSKYVGEFPFLRKKEIKVLDVGAGVGTIPLAFSHFTEELSEIAGVKFDIEYCLCDRSQEMRDVSAILCSDLNIKTVSVEQEKLIYELPDFLRSHSFGLGIDLITISYLLSELTPDGGVDLLKRLIPFLEREGRIIAIEPSYFAPELRKIVAELTKESGMNAILKRVGKDNECYDFCLDMKNKDEVRRIILRNFDVRDGPFFCFSIFGGMKRNDLEYKSCGPRREFMSKEAIGISGRVLSSNDLPNTNTFVLAVAGEDYVGLIYLNDDIMPSDDKNLKGKVIKAIITESKKHKNYEAFYIESTEERVSPQKREEYLRNAEEDEKGRVFKGTIVEIDERKVSIDSKKYGNLTAQWSDSLRILSSDKGYKRGDKIIAFIGGLEPSRFVNFIEKM